MAQPDTKGKRKIKSIKRIQENNSREAYRTALSSPSEGITVLNRHEIRHQRMLPGLVSSIFCRQIFTLDPDCLYKNFGSHNDFLTQSKLYGAYNHRIGPNYWIGPDFSIISSFFLYKFPFLFVLGPFILTDSILSPWASLVLTRSIIFMSAVNRKYYDTGRRSYTDLISDNRIIVSDYKKKNCGRHCYIRFLFWDDPYLRSVCCFEYAI